MAKKSTVLRLERELTEAKNVVKDMLYQFAYRTVYRKRLHLATAGLSALKDGFEVLGWVDPHPIPECECGEPRCHQDATCGTPTSNGYRWTCGDHKPKQ